MLCIPELDLIILQPPRTGSTSLRDAVLKRYPRAKSLYRHMERDGIPAPYASMQVACMIRHPVTRLHSLWRYMRAQRPEDHSDRDWARRVARDASRPFSDWLWNSRDPFNNRPKSNIENPGYYDVKHYDPATRKSLSAWARPDLGPVEILRLEDGSLLQDRLDLTLPTLNAAPRCTIPELDFSAQTVIEQHHAWDLEHYSKSAITLPPILEMTL